jgi:two-component system nitrogen regulation response regulator GlnG
MATILVIDDEQSVRYSFKRVLAGDHLQVATAASAAEGRKMLRELSPDVIVLDLQLPDGNGLDLFREIHQEDPKRPVIFVTAHGTTETAIEAMKSGAFDYLVKPLDLEKLSQLIDQAVEAVRLMREAPVLPVEEKGDRIIGRTSIMQEMCKAIGRIAAQDVNVLILGESGTGKELVARALYHHSRREDQPFLAINCAAIPEALLESELFGHEEGAFTGANRRRIGKFEQCDGGTLFLDEIGDMSAALQAKMLRVLQDQQFQRVGSNETIRTQARVLAATNHDLDKLVEQGRFRKDLYYRLKVVTLRVPPLRDRLDDVPELAHYFLFRFDRELGLDFRGFTPEALQLLQTYEWPGNVRELQSAVKQAMLHGAGHTLLAEHLPEELRRPVSSQALNSGASTPDLAQWIDSLLKRGEHDVYAKVVEAIERILLPQALRYTHGHQAQASELLGLSRVTLRSKLRALGVVVDKVVAEPEAEDEAK